MGGARRRGGAGRDLHPYLVISTASTTRVLEDSRALTGDGDDLNEVSDTCGSVNATRF